MSETVEAPARVTLGNYVGGEWRGARSGETYEKRNPMRPDEVVAEVPASAADDVDDAVAAAREAFAGWAATPAPQRGNLLVKAAEVVDTRVEDVYALGHIPGALLLPLEGRLTWPESYEKTVAALIASKKPVVAYCA